jgi:hypothetical protein
LHETRKKARRVVTTQRSNRTSPHAVKISDFHLKLNTLLRTSQRQPFGLAGIAH